MNSSSRLHFSNWLRDGLVGAIPVGGGPIEQRQSQATFPVNLSVIVDDDGTPRNESARIDLRLYGPGDVQGLDTRQVLRVEPKASTRNFEPNYLASIEFERADLPWMFSPLSAGQDEGLTPWLVLIVVETQGAEIRASREQTLPILTIADPTGQLPDLSESHYWAHVQLALTPNETVPIEASEVAAAVAAHPDAARARLICPRRLSPDTDYIAAVVPSFAVGVQAGLGLIPEESAKLNFAWTANPPTNLQLPVYFSWEFSTGRAGDFETLVRRLVPRMPPATLGTREMAIDQPGYGLGVDTPSRLDFESALTSPAFTRRTWREPTRTNALATVLNTPAVENRPIVAPPIYGQWPALRNSVISRSGWLNELNLDPRHRGAAGLGADTIRRHQDVLMQLAWQQVGEVEAANRLLRLAQAAREINRRIYRGTLLRMESANLLNLTRPLHARVSHERVTIDTRLRQSRLPNGVLDRTLRRLVAPRGAVVRRGLRLRQMEALKDTRTLLPKLASGQLKTALTGQPQGYETIETLARQSLPKLKIDATEKLALTEELRKGWPSFQPRAVGRLRPKKPNRVARGSISLDDLKLIPDPADQEGRVFREAAVKTLDGLFDLETIPNKVPGLQIELDSLSKNLLEVIDPDVTVVRRVLDRLDFPKRPVDDPIQPIQAAPEYLGAMNEELSDMSPDYLLGQVGKLRPDTITIVKNNAEFIESYLVGLNHEMARELLWRGYPTDQRGSYFRGFWRSIPIEASDSEREPFRDIPPIHEWRSSTRLGSHMRFADDNLVLLIRGELLRRYPRALISAVKGEWTEGDADQRANVRRNGGEIRDGRFRRPLASTHRDHEEKLPEFEAQLPPDIHLLGFGLSDGQARGSIDSNGRPDPNGDAGWFFIIKEPPSGTRFGFDVNPGAEGNVPTQVDQLDWRHVLGVDTPGSWRVGDSAISNAHVFSDGEAGEDHDDLEWAKGAAHMAAIALQKPVLVAMHADDMLPRPDDS